MADKKQTGDEGYKGKAFALLDKLEAERVEEDKEKETEEEDEEEEEEEEETDNDEDVADDDDSSDDDDDESDSDDDDDSQDDDEDNDDDDTSSEDDEDVSDLLAQVRQREKALQKKEQEFETQKSELDKLKKHVKGYEDLFKAFKKNPRDLLDKVFGKDAWKKLASDDKDFDPKAEARMRALEAKLKKLEEEKQQSATQAEIAKQAEEYRAEVSNLLDKEENQAIVEWCKNQGVDPTEDVCTVAGQRMRQLNGYLSPEDVIQEARDFVQDQLDIAEKFKKKKKKTTKKSKDKTDKSSKEKKKSAKKKKKVSKPKNKNSYYNSKDETEVAKQRALAVLEQKEAARS